MEMPIDPKIYLGKAIKEERTRQGLTQMCLASMVGTSKSQIWRIENGIVATSISHLAQIADALDVRTSALIRF